MDHTTTSQHINTATTSTVASISSHSREHASTSADHRRCVVQFFDHFASAQDGAQAERAELRRGACRQEVRDMRVRREGSGQLTGQGCKHVIKALSEKLRVVNFV